MLKLLQQIIEEVNKTDNIHQVLDTVVHRVVSALDTQSCSIFLFNEHTNELVLMATQGLNPSAVGKTGIPFGQGLVSLVAEREEPLNIINAPDHPHYYQVPGAGEQHYSAFLGVPIQHRRHMLGVLIVEQEGQRQYDESEEAFLLTLATQLAGAIAQAQAMGSATFDTEEGSTLPDVLRGIPSASGVAIGEMRVVYPLADLTAVPDQKTNHPEEELANFQEALENTRSEIRILGKRMTRALPEEERVLFDAYIKILDSETLIQSITDTIQQQHFSAQTAVAHVFLAHIQQFKTMDNQYMQERAQDIEDLGRRVLSQLQNDDDHIEEYPEKTILIGQNITPSDLASVPRGHLAAVISSTGSVNSHVAILARALGVPSVMGVNDLPLSKLNNVQAIVDGYIGQAYLAPNEALLHEFQTLADEEHALDEELDVLRDMPAETTDGHRIALYVNTGLVADIGYSLTAGAEGIGLYRTEVPFMTRERFPSTEEQRVIYRQLLGVFAPRPVIIRCLDIGGDKALPYFPIHEDNPFLGWRGIRILLEHPEIFLSQIRAMLRANEGYNNLQIMLPMVTDISEVEEAVRLIKKTHEELVKKEGAHIVLPPIGIMAEVPSTIYEAKNFAKKVDFLSVGTNDLTQYLLAVDRNNPRVANLYNALHPAVLKALKSIVKDVHEEGKTISVCGEMAGDPMAALLLLGMGFDMLSLSAPMLPRIKWVIRKFSITQARKILSEVLKMPTAADIRRYLEFELEEVGLGGLIRAGRH
jgi:phosphotransferase system, enzyme I, PtsP